jgi:AcrR family transcriptional regulator
VPPLKRVFQWQTSAVSLDGQEGSARRAELLEKAYGWVLAHGLADMSLRPLAEAVGSSPRVLLFLFGSKDGLVRALLARARADETALLDRARAAGGDLGGVLDQVWGWLAEPAHRSVLTLWVEAYARSLSEPDGPWAGFARQTVEDWLDMLAALQPARRRRTAAGAAERTVVLAVLRGAFLDLAATGDTDRVTAAVRAHLRTL